MACVYLLNRLGGARRFDFDITYLYPIRVTPYQGRTKFTWTMSVQPIPCLAWRLQPAGLQGLFGYVRPHCQCARSATSVTAPARSLPLTVADGNSTRLGWTGGTIELTIGHFPSLASGSGGLWVTLWQYDSHTVTVCESHCDSLTVWHQTKPSQENRTRNTVGIVFKV